MAQAELEIGGSAFGFEAETWGGQKVAFPPPGRAALLLLLRGFS